MSHMTASAIITEPSNIHPQNNSSFDGSHGNGTLNSFDFLIVCEKVKCACSGRMREFSLILFMLFLCTVTHYSQCTVTWYRLKEVSFDG